MKSYWTNYEKNKSKQTKSNRKTRNPTIRITCVNPSGTVSQLVDSASGIHARHNPYYIRTVRTAAKDPLCKMMKDAGFPNELRCDETKTHYRILFSNEIPRRCCLQTRYDCNRPVETLDDIPNSLVRTQTICYHL